MDITLSGELRPDIILFSESLGRFIVTINPDKKRSFELAMGSDITLIGRVTGKNLQITGPSMRISIPVSELEASYKRPFREY